MIADLEKLIRLIEKDDQLSKIVSWRNLQKISFKDKEYPIYAFEVGSKSPESPVLFITGGVHGIERIGAQLAWSLLKTTIDRLLWDQALRELFQKIRLVVIPLVNPVGYFTLMRSNGNGVDLMRNSPVRSKERVPFLLGGQNFSRHLPWFHGDKDNLELETLAVIRCFEERIGQSDCSIAVDFHSGFGMRDRLWFPHSHSRECFANLPQMHALTQLFEQTHPYHIYQIEPQSKGYILNGDLWDHLYLNARRRADKVFIPLTLEMGSWTWVRKNPLQLLSRDGVFNPIKEHRVKRTYRRHYMFFDFLLRALYSNQIWSELDFGLKDKHQSLGLERWNA